MKPSSSPEPKPIGGFFELEFEAAGTPVHPRASALSTGRSCLYAIVEYLKPKRCYLPHYTCNATLDPFHELGVEVLFYELDAELRPRNIPQLAAGDCFLLTNYWGLQRELCAELSARLGQQLIVDDTHDFHAEGPYPTSWSFTSARKYFGVPDGAFLYIPDGVSEDQVVPADTPSFENISVRHAASRSAGLQQLAFREYQAYERSLPCGLYRISHYSRAMLAKLNLGAAQERRRENFLQMAQALGEYNTLNMPASEDASPFVYPFLPAQTLKKSEYYSQRIFVPTYWPDVLQRSGVTCETALAVTANLIPFPIDHRYGPNDMQRMVDLTLELLGNP
ncbi:MAG: hypothetical protein ACI8QC_000976 [Planctomycetota bacterium]